MGKCAKLLISVMSGMQDANINFTDLQNLLDTLGFRERIKGGHHIYTKESVVEKINIQPLGNKAKAYQVKQVRQLILKYKLGGIINV